MSFSLFKHSCPVKLTPCQLSLADKYFNDKGAFAREIIQGHLPARAQLLFAEIKEFEKRAEAYRKQAVNVRTLA